MCSCARRRPTSPSRCSPGSGRRPSGRAPTRDGRSVSDPAPPARHGDPLLAVVVIVGAGIATLTLHRLRAGMYVIAAGLAVAAVLRLLLRPRAASSLVVRSRHA